MVTSLVLAVTMLVLQQAPDVRSRKCPWDEKGLARWSQPTTWRNGRLPRPYKTVTLRHRVLLDVAPPPLASLTIARGAALVWGNVADLRLRTDFLHVQGEFIIGSTDCRFDKPALIQLTGRQNSKHTVKDMYGKVVRKVILVSPEGTLEIHGKEKTSWTKLAQTIPRRTDIPRCTVVYDHTNLQTNQMARDAGKGYNIIVWNEDGTVFDFLPRLTDFNDLKSHIDSVPTGKVIGMYPINETPCCMKGKDAEGFGVLHDVVQNVLGGTLITSVRRVDDMYVLLTRKGNKQSTLEYFESKGRESADFTRTFLRLTDWDTERVFLVAKSFRSWVDCFQVITTDAAYPVLEMAEDIVGWEPGDKIVVASTDFDFSQAEVRELVACPACTKSQIRVNDTFLYMHFGNITFLVDERAEVGLLSRNIKIEGVMEDSCYEVDIPGASRAFTRKLCKRFGMDTFGGHIKILIGHTSVHIEGAELYHMGQQGYLGSYPIHFHMCDNANGTWARDNSIHHTFQRCVTIHGTDEVEVSSNVCYDHLGHGYFLEDSVEQNNIIDHNLGLLTRHGSVLLSDSKPEWCAEDYPKEDFTSNCGDVATFWLTHPNNVVTNNAAAGGVSHGFMYVFADVPLGPSFERQLILKNVKKHSARSSGIKLFSNNTAHSYLRSGVFFDSHISTGIPGEKDEGVPETGIIQEENYYEPKTPNGEYSGKRVWNATLDRMTSYKNKRNNMWIKGGNINVTYCSLADSGMQSFSGGLTGLQTGVSIEYCVMIGQSENYGEPRFWKEQLSNGKYLTHQFDRSIGRTPWATITGVGIYQGPMFIKHTYFDQFQDRFWNDSWTVPYRKRPVSYAGGVSFKRDSTYPTYTSQYSIDVSFGYCDNEDGDKHWVFFGEPDVVVDWQLTDGPKQVYNSDLDGSLTGTPDTRIVRNRAFFTGPACTYRPDWNLSVCPYRYIKLEILGSTGSLSSALKDHWSLIGHRDDEPQDPYFQNGRQRREYLLRTHKSYLIDFNTTMPGARWPDDIKVFAYGLEKQDIVRVGMCVPKDMTDFEIYSDYPVVIRNTNYTVATSLQEVDDDPGNGVIFHDTTNGIIFFKMWSRHDRTNDSQLCVAGLCPMIKIKLLTGSKTKMRSCYKNKGTERPDYQPYQDNRTQPAKHVIPTEKCFSKKSPVGKGAVRWDEVSKLVHHDYTVPCATVSPASTPGRGSPSNVGCFVYSTQNFETPQRLSTTMSPAWCTLRCYTRGYKYAGLTWSQGPMCACQHTLTDSTAARNIKNRKCNKRCPGDREGDCGDGDRVVIWTTGLAP
ncbi:cell surface hyaluronidase-like [Littorina saxatilis]|uniref:G8 domain-containing protein n=1 Tax=Littorina saxatilis TaxID=31220 RepID=A0AAN9FZR8_9CAEN